MLDVRRAAANLLLFVAAVMAWRAMPLRLMAGGPQGLQAKPGGDTRPRANHRPRVDDGRDPAIPIGLDYSGTRTATHQPLTY